MHFIKPISFFAIFMCLCQIGVAQISQGTLVFKEEINMDWEAFEKMMLSSYPDNSEDTTKTVEEEKQAAEWEIYTKNYIDIMKEQAKLAATDSTVYIFTDNQAVAVR
ncbi:MAG: hypothetical protein LH618_03890, partial [Saprospiraceae bacterium]|nr:hypothetical protein [Saprospiraceae bacterium]